MIEVVLNKIKVDENRNEQVIVLKEKNGTRFLPVVIGMPEVNSIKLKLSGVVPPRPLTHDLILKIVEQLGGKIQKIVIDGLQSNTFFAKLYVSSKPQGEVVIDCRPSDSIALALRAEAPIYVADEILGEAGVSEL